MVSVDLGKAIEDYARFISELGETAVGSQLSSTINTLFEEVVGEHLAVSDALCRTALAVLALDHALRRSVLGETGSTIFKYWLGSHIDVMKEG